MDVPLHQGARITPSNTWGRNVDALTQAHNCLKSPLKRKVFSAIINFIARFYQAGPRSYHASYREKALEILETLYSLFSTLNDNRDRQMRILNGARPLLDAVFENYGHFQLNPDQYRNLLRYHGQFGGLIAQYDLPVLVFLPSMPTEGSTTVNPSDLSLPLPQSLIDPTLYRGASAIPTTRRTSGIPVPGRSFDFWVTPDKSLRSATQPPPSTSRRLASNFGSLSLGEGPRTAPILVPITPRAPDVSPQKPQSTPTTIVKPKPRPKLKPKPKPPKRPDPEPEPAPTIPLTARQIQRSEIFRRQGKKPSYIEAVNRLDAPKFTFTPSKAYLPPPGNYVPKVSARINLDSASLIRMDVDRDTPEKTSASPLPSRPESPAFEQVDEESRPCSEPPAEMGLDLRPSASETEVGTAPNSPVAKFLFPQVTAPPMGRFLPSKELLLEWRGDALALDDDGVGILNFSLSTAFGIELQQNTARLEFVASWVADPADHEWPRIQFRVEKNGRKLPSRPLWEPQTSDESVINITPIIALGVNAITIEVDADSDDAMKNIKLEVRIVRQYSSASGPGRSPRKRGQSDLSDDEMQQDEVTPCPSPVKRTRI